MSQRFFFFNYFFIYLSFLRCLLCQASFLKLLHAEIVVSCDGSKVMKLCSNIKGGQFFIGLKSALFIKMLFFT